MTEINTFSACIDDASARSGRPDRKTDLISFARAAIRELQVQQFFDRDHVEAQVTAFVEPYIWTKPIGFRQFNYVEYGAIVDPRGQPVSPKFLMPSRLQKEHKSDYYYYAAGNYFVFAGTGADLMPGGSLINLSYYSYATAIPYFEVASRPARFILEDNDWTYLTATTDDEKEAARAQVTNWLLENWYDAVLEGALAKLYKTYADERSVSTFALFSQMKKDILRGEGVTARQQP